MAKKSVKKAVKDIKKVHSSVLMEPVDVNADTYKDLEKEIAITNSADSPTIPNSVYMKLANDIPEKEEQKVPVPVVSVNYFGRYGNNLFQYVAARLFAERNGYNMITPPPNGFLTVKNHPEIKMNKESIERYNTTMLSNMNNPVVTNQDSIVVFNGYFQDSKEYNPYRQNIKEMFDLKPIQKNTEDIVVHLRLTDYLWRKNKWVISPLWYIQLIKKEKYRNCYIVVEPHVTNSDYLKYFNNIKGIKIVTGNTAAEDFEFIRSFDRIICSNSTFCWWAAFLSDASKIYTFKPWIRDPKVNLSDIPNGKAVPGEFFRIKKFENLDWTDYWKK